MMRRLSLLLAMAAVPLSAKVNFKRDVKPVLENRCVRCHDSERASKGLRLDRQDRAMLAIVKKKPEDSRVYMAAKSGYMPPGEKKLTAAELETFRRWIAEGARWPKGLELRGINPFVTPK